MSNPDLGELRALVVDDQPFVRKAIVNIVLGAGVAEVLEAGDGEEAAALLASDSGDIDVIFCDLQMPGQDGIEFIRHLSGSGLQAGIVLVSGQDEVILKAAGNLVREQGLNLLGNLSKPVTAEQVTELLGKIGSVEPKKAWPQQAPIEVDELRRAIAKAEIVPFFQPKIEMKTRAFHSVEALARWLHPEKGMISPGAFIPLAEANGLIDDLTNVMLEQALSQVRQWQESGLEVQLSFNLSIESLDRLDLPETLAKIAEKSGVETSQIVLELTESRISTEPTALLDITTRLRLKQFLLSIDDFGTGYSSLQQLQRLPFTELKVDQAFVTGASEDKTARSILESSIDLATKLGMKIVVEGVETRADWDLVESLGCDLAQGYYMARPMPGEEIPAWHGEWQNMDW